VLECWIYTYLTSRISDCAQGTVGACVTYCSCECNRKENRFDVAASDGRGVSDGADV